MAAAANKVVQFGQYTCPTSQMFLKTALSYGLVNLKPVVPGHVLICPFRKVERFAELTGEEVSDLFLTAQKVGVVIQEKYEATALTLALQDGPDAGQTVRHVHVHVMPRKGNDFPENDDVYKELQNHDKPGVRVARSEEEMTAEALELRKLFPEEMRPPQD